MQNRHGDNSNANNNNNNYSDASIIIANNNNNTATTAITTIRCNICDEVISSYSVAQHVAGRNHAIKKRVAEFNEMNAQIGSRRSSSSLLSPSCSSYQHDTSVLKMWIRDLHNYDFLSTGKT